MASWLLLAALMAATVLAATGGVRVRRYSRSHIVGHVALGGRGLFFSHTPDGFWWRLRFRSRRCGPGDWRDAPPDASGVREPRVPCGPGPLVGAAAFEPLPGSRRQ
ncbi:MAG: hypothetical protein M3296_01005 [Actinomycetota bacterium]|nr:hypothetical protein [Actinomycetota bacterium]